jgi:hypothetical protein
MYELKIDEDVFQTLVLNYLKDSLSTVMQENEYMTHPEDRAYNTHLLPALLTVIKYFSIPDQYDEYVYQVFGSDDDSQLSFNFGGTDE